jgi:sigma-B regulation protein RsbU (phosphoserine phosphatase)
MLHTVLRNMAELPSPDRLLEELNRRLFARRIGNSFVTALAGAYDADSGILEFAGAGHPPPLLHGDDGVREIELDGGPPLGILDEIGSRVTTHTFSPGERVLLYTDGISEAMSPTSELFGVSRVIRAMEAAPRPPSEPQTVLHAIDQAIRAHIGDAKPGDDQTALVLERR